MNDHEAQRIAAAMHELRPDWPTNSLLTLLRKKLIDKPRRDVTVALSWVACESNSATPARVLEAGPWWRAACIENTTSATTSFDPATCCTVCSKPDDGRHPEDHRFQSENDRRRQLAAEGDAEADRIDKAKDWARQGIYGAKDQAPTKPEPEPLPSLPEVDRLRAQLGGKPDPPPEDRVGGDETSDEEVAVG